jgi:hypothetical protein
MFVQYLVFLKTPIGDLVYTYSRMFTFREVRSQLGTYLQAALGVRYLHITSSI